MIDGTSGIYRCPTGGRVTQSRNRAAGGGQAQPGGELARTGVESQVTAERRRRGAQGRQVGLAGGPSVAMATVISTSSPNVTVISSPSMASRRSSSVARRAAGTAVAGSRPRRRRRFEPAGSPDLLADDLQLDCDERPQTPVPRPGKGNGRTDEFAPFPLETEPLEVPERSGHDQAASIGPGGRALLPNVAARQFGLAALLLGVTTFLFGVTTFLFGGEALLFGGEAFLLGRGAPVPPLRPALGPIRSVLGLVGPPPSIVGGALRSLGSLVEGVGPGRVRRRAVSSKCASSARGPRRR